VPVWAVALRRDGFGDRLTTGDFDSDGFGDLAVGVPGKTAACSTSGAVHVLYGTPTGVTGQGSQFFTQKSPGVLSTAEQYDLFGDALAAADFDTDGFADLIVGVSGEGIGDLEGAGAVHVLYGTPTGMTGSSSQFFTKAAPGWPEPRGNPTGFAHHSPQWTNTRTVTSALASTSAAANAQQGGTDQMGSRPPAAGH
jgi:FG-GAP repeat